MMHWELCKDWEFGLRHDELRSSQPSQSGVGLGCQCVQAASKGPASQLHNMTCLVMLPPSRHAGMDHSHTSSRRAEACDFQS